MTEGAAEGIARAAALVELTLAESGLVAPDQIARVRDAVLGIGPDDPESRSVGTTLGAEPAIDLVGRGLRVSDRGPKYAPMELLGKGGMGEVRLAVDRDLRREVAVKRMRQPASPRLLVRFLEEAQVTGQLEHPNIVPVHELGYDRATGSPYLVMRRIRGRSLSQVLGAVRAGERTGLGPEDEEVEPPTRGLSRLLDVFRKMASGVAYAHSRGVIHRDLKPDNVMTAEFGEVLVMDWGLARVRGQGTGDRGQEGVEVSTPADGERTAAGAVLGTPRYMSPEQAWGKNQELDEKTDIYSLGAILYEIVSLVPPIEGGSVEEILVKTARGQFHPPSVRSMAPWPVPREIEAVVAKAMALEPADRYLRVLDLIEDVDAYLEGRTLAAVRYSLAARAIKWVRRNRAVSATSGVAAALLVFFIGWLVWALGVAREQESLANQRAQEVERGLEDVLRLSDASRVDEIEGRIEDAWRGFPADVSRLEAWSDEAREVAARLPHHREQLERLGETDAVEEVARRWLTEHRRALIERLEGLAAPIEEIECARSKARELRERLTGVDRPDWDRARAQGLEIDPTPGLVPLGRDAASGRWEFLHLMTGERPERDEEGRIRPTEGMGIILVLVPGGEFQMGSEARRVDEVPVHAVTVRSFLVSKFEMTQGQWNRATGDNPSHYHRSPVHPVEQVAWRRCRSVILKRGLRLPSEAEWEYAARAGTTTAWWTGDDPEVLAEAGNLQDRAYEKKTGDPGEMWNDRHAEPAPVGWFSPNPFGLHDTIGNVWEWCEDTFQASYEGAPSDGSPWIVEGGPDRIVRGGSFGELALYARSASRYGDGPDLVDDRLGVRPAMDLPAR